MGCKINKNTSQCVKEKRVTEEETIELGVRGTGGGDTHMIYVENDIT